MSIPKEVKSIADKLGASGYQAYLVGGCLRDLLLENPPAGGPKDWDLTTDAAPEKIQKVFPDSVYENKFGTVGIKTHSEDATLALVEVTTFRKEGKYTDKRHPDEITFAKNVEEDLSRRDFTVNAMAFSLTNDKQPTTNDGLVDPFGGREDLKNKTIRAVGDAAERFEEDALRLMRAVRFSAQLGFEIEEVTAQAIKAKAGLLEFIAKERIRDEFCKLVMTKHASNGIRKMAELGLLKHVLPELCEGIGMDQNLHHKYTIFEHNVRALEYAAEQKFPLYLRVASLLHDVGKPQSRGWKASPQGTRLNKGAKGEWTFYQHQYFGEKIAIEALDRLKFAKKDIEQIALLVREHMFSFDAEIGTQRGARRFVSRVGAENVDDLMKLREADRIGSGTEVAVPQRLRKFKATIEIAMKEPISAKMLKLDGKDLMKVLEIEPGPKVGAILAVLLEKVLDNPALNTKEGLMKEVGSLGKLSDKKLAEMREKASKEADETQERIDQEVMKQYGVKNIKKVK
ncbi:MAG: HD domain-containing protein [bacterium]|nr:HD domain-containing protein [bacterium]